MTKWPMLFLGHIREWQSSIWKYACAMGSHMCHRLWESDWAVQFLDYKWMIVIPAVNVSSVMGKWTERLWNHGFLIICTLMYMGIETFVLSFLPEYEYKFPHTGFMSLNYSVESNSCLYAGKCTAGHVSILYILARWSSNLKMRAFVVVNSVAHYRNNPLDLNPCYRHLQVYIWVYTICFFCIKRQFPSYAIL